MYRKKTVIPLIIVIALMAFVIAKIYRHYQIETCIKKGGFWNEQMNRCQTVESISNSKDYYWHITYDSIRHREHLEKGRLIPSVSHSTTALIEILNKRAEKCKIKYLGMSGDTLRISILHDEVLTEQLGSTGAHCYLGETVYTLTENESFKKINIQLTEGTHAGPGIYDRKDFTDLAESK